MGQEYFTIDGFEQLTEQQIFDIAVDHIQNTRTRSYRGEVGCVYGGSGCAAAALLKPEHRDAADKVGSWVALAYTEAVPSHLKNFIKQIQWAHDSTGTGDEFMPDWNDKMRKIALVHNLDTSKLEVME